MGPDPKIVVLLSGGIDSILCAETSRAAGTLRGCVFIDYGHSARLQELGKSLVYCERRDIALKVITIHGLGLGDMAAETGAHVVASRNAILLAAATNYAATVGANTLWIGCNAADQRDYVDCRPGFLNALAGALGVWIHAPLISSNKAEIVQSARRMGLTRKDAWACYTAGPGSCGMCPSCVEADHAWGAA